MGTLERDFKKKKKRHDIQKAILDTIKAAGLLSVVLIAPGTLKCLKHLGLDSKERQKEIIKRSRNRLVKRGLLVYQDGFLRLTPKGEMELKSLEMKDWKNARPKKWDGRWRVLIFDIPEKRKSLREKVRNTLLSIGFMRLQDSVWLYPYDCEDFINLLKADFKIGKDLLYLIVESIENDKSFRKEFDILQNS
ncbi:MAG: CRISPR-associated endonuclease Cas2 [Patescibacteria group bacterium]